MAEWRWLRHPLVQLTLVRYREFYREPEAIFWVFIFPVLLTAGLGIAFRSRAPERTPVALVATHGDTTLAGRLARDDGLKVRTLTDSAATQALRAGDVALVVVATGSGVEYRYDPERPDAREARLRADEAVQRAAGRSDPVPARERTLREAGSRYVDFVVPGLLGMNLMGSGIWGIGFAIVDARRKHLLKRLVATPMSRTQFLASFVLSRLTFLVLEVALLLGFATLVFGVPLRGSPAVLAGVCLLSALAFASLGLLLAARPRTVEGVSGLMNLVMLPMWIFSGVFFSSARFPDAVQPLIKALPLTAVNDALRATMLRGAGLGQLVPELAVIIAWLVLSFALAVRLFRWR
ncbi:MAG TPA: ABC transporter permease [Gemmatimonadales bacterium]|nr:ABC transporter permease [Gemmatimonadales bacterium]